MFQFSSRKRSYNMLEERGLLHVALDVYNYGAMTRFSCSISNIGSSNIELGNTFLFIDQGVFNEQDSSYKFPFLQKKFLGIDGISDDDCIMSAQCKKDEPIYPILYSHIIGFFGETSLFHNCYSLPHLSSKSILYMAPHEVFSEELILKLNAGVYRAILVSVPAPESCDCICCNRCFCV